MKKVVLMCGLAILIFSACSKQVEDTVTTPKLPVNEFVKYTIARGQQSSNKTSFVEISTSELKFVTRFDSSAVYTTVDPLNQKDINKLFGFSDNNGIHTQYSATFGWRWSNGALRLFAYVYNNGLLSLKELGTVTIGQEVPCSIKVSGNNYVFTMGDVTETIPRASTTPVALGYRLFPYFGGDEMAPQDINIWIKEVL